MEAYPWQKEILDKFASMPSQSGRRWLIVEIMKQLPSADREALFENILPRHFCMHCGSLDTNCQCWNDE